MKHLEIGSWEKKESGCLILSGDKTAGWKIAESGFNSSLKKKLSPSLSLSLHNVQASYGGILSNLTAPEGKVGWEMKLTAHLCLVLMLNIGAL